MEADNVRIHHEWQAPPISYLGPALDDVAGRISYRFDVDRPIKAARLYGIVFCGDETHEHSVVGQSVGTVAVSRDGTTWFSIVVGRDLELRG